jgi:uncharacterized coiled-coil DUF342 family protein
MKTNTKEIAKNEGDYDHLKDDIYFTEGLKELWGLGEKSRVYILIRKVKNKVGDIYEYPVARIEANPNPLRKKYQHLSQELVFSHAKEIRKKGAVRLIKKELKKIDKALDEIQNSLAEIETHLFTAKTLPKEVREQLRELAEELNSVSKKLLEISTNTEENNR